MGVRLDGKMARSILAALFGRYDVVLESQVKDEDDLFKTDKARLFAKYLANIEMGPRELSL